MALKRWIFSDIDEQKTAELCGALGISRLAAATLVSRGVDTPEAAKAFIACDYPLGDPMLLADMDIAAERIRRAIAGGERIAIFGDYDVDGIMAAALLHQYLESAGADVVSLLPTRECTGYGLAAQSVDEMETLGAALIVTVDNGVSSHEAVAYAKARGIDTVICDHHKVPEILPDAVAVVDPLRADDRSEFKPLAGVGVALKLAAAVEGCDAEEMLAHYGYLAAIGTVSDVMPLKGENRAIVKYGLEQLKYGENLGLAALIEAAGLDAGNISSRDIAFSLAPLLNAAGRMANAETALAALLTDDPEEAREYAKELSSLNCLRQKTEQEMMASMGAAEIGAEQLNRPILVLAGENFCSGVSGIVCSRLVEQYGKPVIVISVDEKEAKGSGRSLEGFSLYNAIAACGGLLNSFGGHDAAAGFTIDPDKIDSFREQLFTYCRTLSEPVPYSRVRVNSVIEFEDTGEREVEELMRLAPFGSGNEEPVFATLNAEIAEISRLGDRHTRLTFQKGGRRMRAALFGVLPESLLFACGDCVDIAYAPSLYQPPNGRRCVSVKLKNIAPAGFSKEDFTTLRLFDRMCFGQELSPGERERIAPARGDIAAVYREIRKKPLSSDSRECICYRLWDMAPGKAAAAVAVLRDLALVEECAQNGRCGLAAAKNAEKKELFDSPTFLTLHGRKDAVPGG